MGRVRKPWRRTGGTGLSAGLRVGCEDREEDPSVVEVEFHHADECTQLTIAVLFDDTNSALIRVVRGKVKPSDHLDPRATRWTAPRRGFNRRRRHQSGAPNHLECLLTGVADPGDLAGRGPARSPVNAAGRSANHRSRGEAPTDAELVRSAQVRLGVHRHSISRREIVAPVGGAGCSTDVSSEAWTWAVGEPAGSDSAARRLRWCRLRRAR